MRIVFLSDDFPPRSYGGAGMVAHDLARSLAKRDHVVSVITAVPNQAQTGRKTVDGLEVIALRSRYHERWRSWRSLWNPPLVRQVNRLLQELRPDVVHAHNVHYHLSYRCLRLARRHSRAVFLTAHDVMLFHYGKLREFNHPNRPEAGPPFDYRVTPAQQFRRFTAWYNPFRNLFIRRALRSVDKIFAVSAELQHALTANGIRNTTVVPNGVDPDAWTATTEEAAEFHRHFHLVDKHPILFSGRLSDAKGGTQIVRALPAIIRRDPAAILLILGQRTAYADRLLREAETLGVGDRVVFTGWLDGADRRAAYRASAVAVSPSICFDTFGLVAAEAMAAGRPVVVSLFGGMPELIEEGISGFTVNPYNLDALAKRITRLTTDPELAARMGQAAQQRIRERFSLDKQATETLGWYERVLAQH